MSNNIIAIVVYNRFENIKRWLDIWAKCEVDKPQLVIIHNVDSNEEIELPKDIVYIRRKNIGFDIGAFQDVCKNRLKNFPIFDKILWITDDTFPMASDFWKPFFDGLDKPNVGATCMQISTSVKTHIRTTGFALTKNICNKLKFIVDPIKTKEDCYQFEHKGELNLYNQIKSLGLEVVQVAPNQRSPLWDIGFTKKIDRLKEHFTIFPKKEKVLFICPWYKTFPSIISSLIAQTYDNWELLLIHDGPHNYDLTTLPNDARIKYLATKEHKGDWGHYIRQDQLNKNIDADYVVITNADNYHTPNYIEAMVAGFENGTVATYCSLMVHNYVAYKTIDCRLERGYLDCAGVMVRTHIAKKVGWKDINSHSSDWTYFNDIIKIYGQHSFKKVQGCLLVHN